MPGLTFVSKRDEGGSSSVPTSLCPASVQPGDLMICCVALRNATPAVLSTGFTTIQAGSGNNENTITGAPLSAWKIATVLDVPSSTTYVWNGSSIFNWSASIAVYRPATPSLIPASIIVSGANGTSGSGTSISGGTVTAPSASGTLVVCAATNTGLNGELCTYSSTMNERCDCHEAVGSGSRMQTGIYDKIGTDVVAGSNAFEAITQIRSETWARTGFIIDYTLWATANSPMVMG